MEVLPTSGTQTYIKNYNFLFPGCYAVPLLYSLEYDGYEIIKSIWGICQSGLGGGEGVAESFAISPPIEKLIIISQIW